MHRTEQFSGMEETQGQEEKKKKKQKYVERRAL